MTNLSPAAADLLARVRARRATTDDHRPPTATQTATLAELMRPGRSTTAP